jgi:hypothetical protein
VEQPLNVYEMIIKITKKVAPNLPAIKKLEQEESWRPFYPPIFNYIISCIEVFLEKNFLERYIKQDGTKYLTIEDWQSDLSNFKANLRWPSKKVEATITKTFSFQRLSLVEVLYSIALGKLFNNYVRYGIIKIMFAKRHLFTHRGGFIDKKFLHDYNTLQNNNPSMQLSQNDIGKIAYIKKEEVRDSIIEAKAFIDFICN